MGACIWKPGVCGLFVVFAPPRRCGPKQWQLQARGHLHWPLRLALTAAALSVWPQLKRSRETEVQLKPLVEKNKRMNKKNEDLLQSIQRMEEKIKNLTRENVEMVSRRLGVLVSARAPPAPGPHRTRSPGPPPTHLPQEACQAVSVCTRPSCFCSPQFTAPWASVPDGEPGAVRRWVSAQGP